MIKELVIIKIEEATTANEVNELLQLVYDSSLTNLDIIDIQRVAIHSIEHINEIKELTK